MARKSTSQRKIEIINESSQILAKQGYHNLTTKLLSKQLGVAEMILYRCFKNKNAIVLACIEQTGSKQLDHWRNICVQQHDSLHALKTIAADFSFAPSDESTGFQLLQRLCAEQLDHDLIQAISQVYLHFCDFLQAHLKLVAEDLDVPVPSEHKLRQIAWVLVHWGSGLGQMQLLPITETHQDSFKDYQVELAIKFVSDQLCYA